MNPRLLATALMLAGATAACTPEQQAAWDNATGLTPTPRSAPNEPTPAALFIAAADPLPEPPPPALVYAYDHYNADPTGYVCAPVFRQLSCLDDGRPVYLDAQMGQMPFGEHP